MGKITKMNAREIDKEFSTAKIKAMLAKAKISEDDNPFTPEEWRARAEFPNRGRPKKKTVKKDIHIRLDPLTLEKLKAHGRGWQTKLSAKVDEWVSMGVL